ncbi:MAG: radical SAM protein [Candidatus Coatesbacteria bacterium]|nr:radical SAM protein [Candidatus Coatesbacteria bacterium]
MNQEIQSLAVDTILPSTCVIELTYNCNHKCLYCSCPWEAPSPKFKKDKLLNKEEWKKCINHLVEKHNIVDIAFTGGEPTLYPDIKELIAFASRLEGLSYEIEEGSGKIVTRKRKVKIHLISNGRNVSDEIIDLIAENEGSMSVSLPGLKTYSYHTGIENALVPLGTLKRIHDRGIQATLNVTVTKVNLFELYETIAEGLIAGARFLLMNRFLPGGRGLLYSKELSLNREQLIEALDIAESVLSRADIKGSLGTEVPKCVLNGKKWDHISTGTLCSATISFFVIDPSGRVRVCNHSENVLGHWTEIEKIVLHDYWQKFLHKKFIPQICKSCVEIGECDGGCREAANIVNNELCSLDPLLKEEGFIKPEKEISLSFNQLKSIFEGDE